MHVCVYRVPTGLSPTDAVVLLVKHEWDYEEVRPKGKERSANLGNIACGSTTNCSVKQTITQ